MYEEIISRNWGFLTAEDQAKIKDSRILLAGCGLGSNVARLATRTGFSRFVLADGDNVEASNLNRQAFRSEHIGRNKAEVSGEMVREIIPEADVKIFPHFITDKEAHDLVTEVELVVNTVDPGPALFTINSAAQSQNKIVFFPMNIGFGGVVLVFTADSMTLENMLARDVPQDKIFLRLIERITAYVPYISSYLKKLETSIDDILSGVLPGPQLGVAAYLSSALVVTAMVKRVRGQPLPLAPEPLTLDAWFYNQ